MSAFPVDARGLKCPLPVLLARRALKRHAAIELLTTDPASVLDIPVFCAEAGHVIARQVQEGETRRYWITRQVLARLSQAEAINPSSTPAIGAIR